MVNSTFDISAYKGLIIYEIANRKFCADLLKISNIFKLDEIVFPPEFYSNIVSTLHIQNKKFPLINLSLLLDLDTNSISNFSRLLLYEGNSHKYFFLSGKIHHMVTIDRKFLETVDEIEPSLKSEYVYGAVKLENEEVIMLDFEKIFEEYLSENSNSFHKN